MSKVTKVKSLHEYKPVFIHTHKPNTPAQSMGFTFYSGFTSGLENLCQLQTVKFGEQTPEIYLTQTISEQGEGFCQVTQS